MLHPIPPSCQDLPVVILQLLSVLCGVLIQLSTLLAIGQLSGDWRFSDGGGHSVPLHSELCMDSQSCNTQACFPQQGDP